MLPRKETKYIVVSATMTDERIPIREIEWRSRKYGYLDIGCHFVIEASGLISTCRPDHQHGVGVRPHNQASVIVILSGKPPFTDDQMSNLATIVNAMSAKYPSASVVGHNALPGARSDAPGFDVQAWWTGLVAANGL